MSMTTFFAIAAVLILVSVRGWIALVPSASVGAPVTNRIDPSHMMARATELPQARIERADRR
jgi:hypothetical protein